MRNKRTRKSWWSGKLQRQRSRRGPWRAAAGIEALETRAVLTASFPGNFAPPDLDLSAVPQQEIVVGQTFTIDLKANGATVVDLDEQGNPTGDPIRLLLDPDVGTDTPLGATITTDGVFTWTPTADQVGTHRIVVIAVDRGAPALADSEIFTIVVSATGNQAPSIDLNGPGAGTGYNGTFTEDGGPVSAVGATLTITDGDNENLESARVMLVNRPDGTAESLSVDTTGTNITVTAYDPATGELLLSGTDTLANYQQVLRTLTYDNTSQDPSTELRTIEVTVNDGTTDSVKAASRITVVAVNDAPTVDLNGEEEGGDYEATFTEGEGPVAVVGSEATVEDVDNEQLTSATITITNLQDGEAETLAVDTSGTSITASYDESTGVLTLTGAATVAEYQQVLRTLTYNNTAANLDETDRTISVTVSDGTDESVAVTSTVTIVGVNDPPQLEPIAAQEVQVGVTMQVTVTATDPDGDELTFMLDRDNPSGNIPASATITKTSDTTAVIEWTPTAEDGAGPFVFVVLVVDDHPTAPLADQETFTATLTTNETPVVDLNGDDEGTDSSAIFTEGEGPIAVVDPLMTVADADSTQLESATIVLVNRPDGATEMLSVDVTGTSITLTAYNPATGELVLSGIDTIENYEQVLRSLTYDNTSQAPNTEDRIIEVRVNDGSSDSAVATSTVTVVAVNDAPLVDLNGEDEGVGFEATFTEDDDPVLIVSSELTIEDVDSSDLESATVTITNRMDGDAEALAVDTTGTSISAEYVPETGVLTLTGAASVAEYQQVLRTLTYSNSLQNPDTTPRVVEVVVNDGTDDSAVAVSTVTVVGLNDSPQLEAIEDQQAEVGVAMQVTVVATDADGDELTFQLDRDDPSGNIPASATITKTSDTTALIEWTPSLEDGEGPFVFIVLVTDDDATAPLVDQESFTVTLVSDAPVVDLNGEESGVDFAAWFTEGDGPTAVVETQMTVSDNDSENLQSATIVLTNVQDGAAELLAVDTTGTGITASDYDEVTGTITLSGNDTVANYQQVLRSLTYHNTSLDPTPVERIIEITVSDGTNVSATATSTVTIVAVDSSPDLALPEPYNAGTPVEVEAGQVVEFDVSVTDPDTDIDQFTFALDLEASDIPEGEPLPTITMPTDSTPGGTFNWTPTQPGTYTIVVMVVDDTGLADQETFTLNVVAAEESPQLEGEPSDDVYDLALEEVLDESWV